ncbi:vWA domain-containing protein [Candidatus Caldatribacterium saccharofermentans]|uniref:vWA domain-containing protein n=1 Tax=Candidatus Caldatribacterium saccharofermentans TaxID=1454753 RepID=UPI003D001653
MVLRVKVDREITRMVVSHPIIASVLLKLRVEIRPKKEMLYPAALDLENRILFIREDLEETRLPLSSILAHEAMHILNGTLLRRESRDVILWNYATDLEINWMLKDMGFDVSVGLYSERFHNMHAEEIYEHLKRAVDWEAKQIIRRIARLTEKIGQGGKGGRDFEKKVEQLREFHKKLRQKLKLPEDGEMTPDPDARNEETRAIARQFIIDAAISAWQLVQAGIGTMPGGWKRVVEKLSESRVRWQDLLEGTIVEAIAADYSYRRPYKPTLLYCDVYTPSLNEQFYRYHGTVFVIVDTSGSISQEDLSYFLGEVQEILKQYRVVFIACDAAVQAVVEDGDIQEILKHVKGGGGTVLAPAFKWIEEHAPDECAPVVLMTDGYNADKKIPRPSNMTKLIVLTTGKLPGGIEADYVIRVSREEKE